MKMGNITLSTYRSRAGMLIPTLARLPGITILSTHTYLCGSLPRRSVDIYICVYMQYKQLYEYNKPETIICSHDWAAPHLHPATPAQQLLACGVSSPPITVSPGPHISVAPTPLTVLLTIFKATAPTHGGGNAAGRGNIYKWCLRNVYKYKCAEGNCYALVLYYLVYRLYTCVGWRACYSLKCPG